LNKLTAGRLKDHKKLITKLLNDEIYQLFSELVDKRNSIIHSIPTGKMVDDYAVSIYWDKNGTVDIDKEYLLDFIKGNERLCLLVHEVRGY